MGFKGIGTNLSKMVSFNNDGPSSDIMEFSFRFDDQPMR